MHSLYTQCDLHVHTRYSACAQVDMRVPEIVAMCEELGIRYLGISDHIYAGVDARFLGYTRQDVNALKTDVRVYVGCEVDILDIGVHTATQEMVAALDYVMVAANHFHDRTVAQPPDESPESVARHFLGMFRYACTLGFADIIAHPLVVYPGTFDPRCLGLLKDDELMEAIRQARENDIAMEISPRALAREQIEFRLRFYRLCKKAGVRFSIGSDAHRLSNVGNVRVLEPVIRELGLTDEDIWLPNDGS